MICFDQDDAMEIIVWDFISLIISFISLGFISLISFIFNNSLALKGWASLASQFRTPAAML